MDSLIRNRGISHKGGCEGGNAAKGGVIRKHRRGAASNVGPRFGARWLCHNATSRRTVGHEGRVRSRRMVLARADGGQAHRPNVGQAEPEPADSDSTDNAAEAVGGEQQADSGS